MRCSRLNLLRLLILVSTAICLVPFLLFEKSTMTPIVALDSINNNRTTTTKIVALNNDDNNRTTNNNQDNNTTKPQKKPKRIRNKHNRTRLHKYLGNLSKEELRLEELNSVDYWACCGLGHRFTKLTDAWYVSRKLNVSLRPFWGFCDEHTEVFSYLFGSQPADEIQNVEAGNMAIQLRNEVPGMNNLVRGTYKIKGGTELCGCDGHDDKFESDTEFYKSLQRRFRFRESVLSFQQQHKFGDHTVLGVHVRAGNGETGDFANKNRGIQNIETWVTAICKHLKNMILNRNITNPMFYIATDTSSVIKHFRNALDSSIPVVDLPQQRAYEGVLFGENNAVTEKGSQCLSGWVQAVTDMMILSSANIVIAARPSSFVQSMPQSMVFSRRGTNKAFCEFTLDASKVYCYDNYREWCCTTKTVDILQHINPYEYIRLPAGPVQIKTYEHKVRSRRKNTLVMPMFGSTTRTVDLPYSWDKLYTKL